METVVHGLENVIVYIDDLLIHSADHSQHLQLLDELLQRLALHKVEDQPAQVCIRKQGRRILGFPAHRRRSQTWGPTS
jgi:hypothetical protein